MLCPELRVLKGLLDVVRDGLADWTALHYDRGHASVAVVNTGEAVRPTSLGKLGEAVGEVAQRGAGRYGEHAECGNGDACACIEAVQQEHEPSNSYSRNCK